MLVLYQTRYFLYKNLCLKNLNLYDEIYEKFACSYISQKFWMCLLISAFKTWSCIRWKIKKKLRNQTTDKEFVCVCIWKQPSSLLFYRLQGFFSNMLGWSELSFFFLLLSMHRSTLSPLPNGWSDNNIGLTNRNALLVQQIFPDQPIAMRCFGRQIWLVGKPLKKLNWKNTIEKTELLTSDYKDSLQIYTC